VVSREMTEWQLAFLQMISTALLATSSAMLFEDIRIVLTPGSIAALLYLTIVATLLTTVLQTKFQKDTTPTRAVIIFSMEPVVAAIVANRVLGEQLGSLGILGGACVIAGIVVSEVSDGIPYLNKPVYRENS
jgi:drug/metabolite transporter (DMT)-like permease